MLRTLVPTLLVLAGLALVAWADEGDATDLAVGAAAPAWRLNDHTGTARTLAEAHEDAWVVLAFFPKAATPG